MKVNYLTLLAGATMVLLSAAARAEESAASALALESNAAPPTKSTTASAAPKVAAAYNNACYDDTATYCDNCDPVAQFIARAGAWGVIQSGSPTKVGEYQDLKSSPFAQITGIASSAERSIDFDAQVNDDETNVGRAHYYGPSLEADVDYERFLHELDSKTYPGWVQGPAAVSKATTANFFTRDDLNPGQNYAIRVQDYKARFHGCVTDNLKWYVNAFGIDKEGFRQANAFTHCYNATPADVNGTSAASGGQPYPQPFRSFGSNTVNRQCHAISQSQHIDWTTNEVEAGLELRLGCESTINYSHLVRAFTANDQQVINIYRSGSTTQPSDAGNLGFAPPATGGAFSTAGYGIVPDNQTQIDRLKFSTKIGCDTDLYLLGYAGYNEDLLRDTYRNFNGTDLRITNRSLEHVALTARAKYYREDSTIPVVPLNTQYGGGITTSPRSQFYQESNLSQIGDQINREVHAFGVDSRWCPFEDDCHTLRGRLAFVSGYEYSTLMRENADVDIEARGSGRFVTSAGTAGGVFTPPDTNKNTFVIGVEEKWCREFDTYLRYKFISTQYPLYGVTSEVATSIDASLNSALPTQENRIEVGCTWTPTDCLMVNATLYVENAMSDAPYVNWQSNSLPFTVSAWYAASDCWSFNAGAAEMDSWINQDVSMGPLNAPPAAVGAITVPWKFYGTSDVLTFGSRYAATEKLSFSGEFEWVHGINTSVGTVTSAQQSPPGGAAYDLGQFSLVKMQSYRFGVGSDYLLRRCVTTYVRYNYYDYQDDSGFTSGQAHMILGGVSAKF